MKQYLFQIKQPKLAQEFVHKIITRYGVPKCLLTDQGRNFLSTLFKEVCSLLGIHKLKTTPYHPQCNGMIEWLHKTLSDIISHFVTAEGKNWDDVIPYALMPYRCAPHSVAGYSPHILLFGEEMNLPTAEDLSAKIEIEDEIKFELSKLQAKLNKI